jgi:hypothetical protein
VAVECGTLIYIAVVDLVPELVRTRQRSAIPALLIGAIVVAASALRGL